MLRLKFNPISYICIYQQRTGTCHEWDEWQRTFFEQLHNNAIIIIVKSMNVVWYRVAMWECENGKMGDGRTIPFYYAFFFFGFRFFIFVLGFLFRFISIIIFLLQSTFYALIMFLMEMWTKKTMKNVEKQRLVCALDRVSGFFSDFIFILFVRLFGMMKI